MAYIQFKDRLEVDITFRVVGFRDRGDTEWKTTEKPEEIKKEVLEEKKFNKLTVAEALKKLAELVTN